MNNKNTKSNVHKLSQDARKVALKGSKSSKSPKLSKAQKRGVFGSSDLLGDSSNHSLRQEILFVVNETLNFLRSSANQCDALIKTLNHRYP